MYDEERKRKKQELLSAIQSSGSYSGVGSPNKNSASMAAKVEKALGALSKKKQEGPKLSDYGKDNKELSQKADVSIDEEEMKKKKAGFADAVGKKMYA